jgi:hypothetical protein
VPTLFGDRREISLQLPHRQITLQRPAKLEGNLLVADKVENRGGRTVVTLKAIEVSALHLHNDAPMYAPATPAAPNAKRDGEVWKVRATDGGKHLLYVDGKRYGSVGAAWALPLSSAHQCLRVTRRDEHGIESLPSEATCVGDEATVTGSWPRTWTAPRTGRYRVWLDYTNDHGPINTGITAGVKRLAIDCAGRPVQTVPIVMPHSIAGQRSTTATFEAMAGARCSFALEQGFNMSDLAHFVHYTGGVGGASGPLNEANVDALHIAPLPAQ